MHHPGSEEDSPTKSTTNSTTVPTTSAHTSAQPTIPQISQPELKIDADAEADMDGDVDMLDDSDVQFITDTNDFLDANDMQICAELLPTIKSVTSLHPSKFNELYTPSQIDSGNIL